MFRVAATAYGRRRLRVRRAPSAGPRRTRPCEFRGADRLSHVPLRVFGNMHDEADYRRRELLPAHGTRLAEGARIDRTNLLLGTIQRGIDCGQKFFAWSAGILLGTERIHLFIAQLFAPEVSCQAMDASGDVPQVKSERREAVRAGPDLLGGEAGGMPGQVFPCLLKSVKSRRERGVNVQLQPAKPGFRKLRHYRFTPDLFSYT
jgi:hypothetical protein